MQSFICGCGVFAGDASKSFYWDRQFTLTGTYVAAEAKLVEFRTALASEYERLTPHSFAHVASACRDVRFLVVGTLLKGSAGACTLYAAVVPAAANLSAVLAFNISLHKFLFDQGPIKVNTLGSALASFCIRARTIPPHEWAETLPPSHAPAAAALQSEVDSVLRCWETLRRKKQAEQAAHYRRLLQQRATPPRTQSPARKAWKALVGGGGGAVTAAAVGDGRRQYGAVGGGSGTRRGRSPSPGRVVGGGVRAGEGVGGARGALLSEGVCARRSRLRRLGRAVGVRLLVVYVCVVAPLLSVALVVGLVALMVGSVADDGVVNGAQLSGSDGVEAAVLGRLGIVADVSSRVGQVRGQEVLSSIPYGVALLRSLSGVFGIVAPSICGCDGGEGGGDGVVSLTPTGPSSPSQTAMQVGSRRAVRAFRGEGFVVTPTPTRRLEPSAPSPLLSTRTVTATPTAEWPCFSWNSTSVRFDGVDACTPSATLTAVPSRSSQIVIAAHAPAGQSRVDGCPAGGRVNYTLTATTSWASFVPFSRSLWRGWEVDVRGGGGASDSRSDDPATTTAPLHRSAVNVAVTPTASRLRTPSPAHTPTRTIRPSPRPSPPPPSPFPPSPPPPLEPLPVPPRHLSSYTVPCGVCIRTPSSEVAAPPGTVPFGRTFTLRCKPLGATFFIASVASVAVVYVIVSALTLLCVCMCMYCCCCRGRPSAVASPVGLRDGRGGGGTAPRQLLPPRGDRRRASRAAARGYDGV